MKVGLVVNNLDNVRTEATTTENLGFDYIATGEHLFFHGPTSNAFVLLAAAAGATESIRLVSTITLLPLYPAALVAKLSSVIDRVSNGRFNLGVGAGGEFPAEFEAVGIDPTTRFRRLDEALILIAQLFSGEEVTFEGEFTQLSAQLQPAPLQNGGPPIWLAGRKAGGIRRAGKFADVWIPYMLSVEGFYTGFADVKDAAEQAGRDREDVAGAVYLFTCVDEDRLWARNHGITHVSKMYRQDFTKLADRYLLLGDPNDVVDRINAYRSAGANRVILNIAADDEHRTRVVQALATHVLPRVSRA